MMSSSRPPEAPFRPWRPETWCSWCWPITSATSVSSVSSCGAPRPRFGQEPIPPTHASPDRLGDRRQCETRTFTHWRLGDSLVRRHVCGGNFGCALGDATLRRAARAPTRPGPRAVLSYRDCGTDRRPALLRRAVEPRLFPQPSAQDPGDLGRRHGLLWCHLRSGSHDGVPRLATEAVCLASLRRGRHLCAAWTNLWKDRKHHQRRHCGLSLELPVVPAICQSTQLSCKSSDCIPARRGIRAAHQSDHLCGTVLAAVLDASLGHAVCGIPLGLLPQPVRHLLCTGRASRHAGPQAGPVDRNCYRPLCRGPGLLAVEVGPDCASGDRHN